MADVKQVNWLNAGVNQTFEGVREWLASYPDQCAGDPCSVCQTGEEYIEFAQYGLARPDDVGVIENQVASLMRRMLQSYFDERGGRIYWRIPLESEVADYEVVVKYDENGPDVDTLFDKRCVKDKNWKRVAAYCRVYRAPRQTMQPA